MSKTANRWLLGCGLGCGAVIVIMIVAVGACALWIRNTVKGFDAATRTDRQLVQRYGPPSDYVPPADGVPHPERIEVFLAVREATQPARERMVERLQSLAVTDSDAREIDSKSFGEKMRFALRMGNSAAGLVPDLASFFEARNRALLDEQMGLGEYAYIYALAYYSWLGHEPRDAPGLGRVRIHTGDADLGGRGGGDEPVGAMGVRFVTRLHGELLAMLRRQRDSLPPGEGSGAWRRALAREIEAMESEPGRMPWQDDLPPAIATALEPYRARLEATYVAAANPFELARSEKSSRWSFEVK